MIENTEFTIRFKSKQDPKWNMYGTYNDYLTAKTLYDELVCDPARGLLAIELTLNVTMPIAEFTPTPSSNGL